MLTGRVHIHYSGLNPSETTKVYVESIIHEIETELPEGARLRVTFSKRNDVVKGILQVGSNAGPFFSVAASNNLKDVAFKLIHQMRRRIDKWKTKRHDRNGLKKAIQALQMQAS